MSRSTADIPPLAGRTAVVTGANAGLGLEIAKALAGAGAHRGGFYGPLFVNNGPPVRKPILRRLGLDRAIARLWEVSERETGIVLRP